MEEAYAPSAHEGCAGLQSPPPAPCGAGPPKATLCIVREAYLVKCEA